jgi:hypothetical protein
MQHCPENMHSAQAIGVALPAIARAKDAESLVMNKRIHPTCLSD